MPRDIPTDSRRDLEDRHDGFKEKFRESDRLMQEGVQSGAVVERTAQELVARFTTEGLNEAQRALDTAHDAAADHVDQASQEQDETIRAEANPFAQDNRERAELTRNDEGLARRGAGEVSVSGTARALEQAAKALGEDASFLHDLFERQDRSNADAKENAAAKKGAVGGQDPRIG